MIEGAGAFLGVLEGSYCPEAKTQTAILAKTMLDVLDYEIQKTVVDGIRYKNISHPTQPELWVILPRESGSKAVLHDRQDPRNRG